MKAAGFALALFLAACGNGGTLTTPADADPSGLAAGHRLMERGEPELARKAYLRAAAEQGLNADTLSAIGSADLALGRLGQAERTLRRALEHDPDFVPALNNLGVVLMEQGEIGEARSLFQKAYALDSGETDSIRDNLKLAIARSEASVYVEANEKSDFQLLRQEKGHYVLLTKPQG